MKYDASKPEIFAKAFMYCILATGFAFAVMIPFSFWGGAAASKSTEVRAQWLYTIIDSPFFYMVLAAFWVIAIYSAIKGVPKWVAMSMKIIAAIAILPITLRMLIEEGKWPFQESSDESNT